MYARRLGLRGSHPYVFTPPFSLAGPYDPSRTPGETILTQLHCHTTQSDGSHSPAQIVADYLAAGYQALAITDHDKVTAQPAGITTAIVANELSPGAQHIISLDSAYVRGSLTNAQSLIDGVLGAGGQCFVAHPKWSTGMTYAEQAALSGHLGMEIHNGKVVNGAGKNPVTYPGYAIDRWDQILTGGRLNEWGFAIDDLHTKGAFEAHDLGGIQVFAESNTIDDLIGAIVNGDFVARIGNHGVTPTYPERTDEGVSWSCPGAVRVEAYGAGGVLLASAAASSLDYPFVGTEQYVRLVAIGSYDEDFTSPLDDRWQATQGSWTLGADYIQLGSIATGRIVIRRHRESDFTAQVDVRLGGSGTDDRCELIFHALNGNYYYMLHMGRSGSSAFDNRLAFAKTTTNSFAAGALASTAFSPSSGTWYRMKMDYTKATGTMRAKIWDRDSGSEPGSWMVTASDTTWGHGGFGFRAGGTTPRFTNLATTGYATFAQPIPVES